ncbi:enoyl-CoA hydratase/isomerase family protein [uncultured Jatrophihabitans sp.]|uniref:enoyl-CoA hydratase/isomerase family protein n=1 Tax=uncultured Jatrophihabitans sp. TaxID=1610747 RepID=UPI0035CAEB37
MPDTPVDLSYDGPLAVVTFHSPPLNLFTPAVMDALASALGQVADSGARGLLIQAEGRAVSAGVGVNFFATLDAVSGAAVWRDWLQVVHALEDLPIPTVFAAHALCLTAAFEISLACDLLLAAESARFGLVETVVGLTPSMGGPQRLVERAGPARARELIYTGELFDAATLERWNVVNRVLPDDGFREAAHAFVLRLANGPTRAHAATKLITATAARDGARAADDLTPLVSGALFASDDLQGAVSSFLADGPGKATYTGR